MVSSLRKPWALEVGSGNQRGHPARINSRKRYNIRLHPAPCPKLWARVEGNHANWHHHAPDGRIHRWGHHYQV